MKLTKDNINELLSQAANKKLWFYDSHQNLWLSPRALRVAWNQGRFQDDFDTWELIDPQEWFKAAEKNLQAAQNTLTLIQDCIDKN